MRTPTTSPRIRIPGPGEAKIRIEATDAAAADAILAALGEHFGAAAVAVDAVRDRSRPHRGRPPVDGLAHHYVTVTIPPGPQQ